MKIVGIETSCDETAVAIYDSESGILADEIYSQVTLHSQYGGVVPELASRDHLRRCLPLIKKTLKDIDITGSDIDGIAYTAGPGLIGALMVGASIAKSLAYAWDVPSLGIHHLEAHLMAVFLEKPTPSYPFLTLLVSGGHTLLLAVHDFGDYEVLGESIDDAVGEAFDKTAKLLGLAYPGGAALATLAEKGDPTRFHFPRPMIDRPGLDFSFSGLKTFALNTVHRQVLDEQTKADIARAFEDAVVETMVIKCKRALEETRMTELVCAGGVSANRQLRLALTTLLKKNNGAVFFPKLRYCTDNAAMVAYAGYVRLQRGECDDQAIQLHACWPISYL